jgi:hypothetical protein
LVAATTEALAKVSEPRADGSLPVGGAGDEMDERLSWRLGNRRLDNAEALGLQLDSDGRPAVGRRP